MWWWQIRKRNADVGQELESDLALEEEEQRERGVSPEEARHSALRAFGNPALIREQTSAVWSWTTVENLLRDLRISVRTLFRSPGFSLLAIRGRISFADDVRQNLLARHRIYCRYAAFTWDIEENQIIRQVAHLLSGWGFHTKLRLTLSRLDTTLSEVQPTALALPLSGVFATVASMMTIAKSINSADCF